MFHHDPLHGDDVLDELLAEAASWDTNCEIITAAEGQKLSF